MAIYRAAVNLGYTDTTGGPGVNVWHFRTNAVTGTLQVQDLVDELHTFYDSITNGGTTGSSGFQRNMSISLEEVIDVESSDIVPVDWTTIVTPNVGASAPPVLAQCITWRTSSATRRGRGRTFLGPLSSAALEANGTPNEDVRSVIKAAGDAFIASFAGPDEGAFGVYGREAAGGAGAHVLRDFVTCSVPNEFAVLRSRRD
jgi:hypothetical protein